jgi:hypothetical protein
MYMKFFNFHIDELATDARGKGSPVRMPFERSTVRSLGMQRYWGLCFCKKSY